MAKVHLYSTDNPVRPGAELQANCGKEVHKAQLVFSVEGDLQMLGDLRGVIGGCTKCISLPAKGVYLYGISEGGKA